jgi:hypothetical protein
MEDMSESTVVIDVHLLFGLVREDVICDLEVSLVLLLVDCFVFRCLCIDQLLVVTFN